jgi:hypothetical protein
MWSVSSPFSQTARRAPSMTMPSTVMFWTVTGRANGARAARADREGAQPEHVSS